MRKTIYDVEVSPTRSMVGFMDCKTGKVKQFEHNESDAIAEYIKNRQLIGFNSRNYDDIILDQMLMGTDAKELFKVSKSIVEEDARRWDYMPDVESIDLMEVAPGAGSLKIYGARLNTKQLQDLPYSPDMKLSKKQWKEIKKYNKIDLQVTRELYEELKPQLQIRKDIGKEYKINVMSRSDAQVAEDVFKKALGLSRKPQIDKPKSVTYKAPSYIKFKSNNLNVLKKKYEETVYEIDRRTGKFKPIDWIKENDKISVGGVDYTVGIGGLHSNEKSTAHIGNIKNADISSMYPSLIINSGKYPKQLGKKWLDIYTEFRDRRLKIKYTDKKLSAMLKIFLNGSYGKLNSIYSILYAPHLMLDTTLTGQLSLLMVIEALTNANIKVISANTDGVEYIDNTNKGKKIIDKLGKKMNLGWEHAEYSALYSRDVNSYVAVYDDYVKAKGFYGEPSLSKNPEHPIVTEAIRTFLLTGKPMEETIRECKDMWKFCTSRQVTGGALWSPKKYPDTDEYEAYIAKVPFKQNKALEKRNDDYKKTFILAEANVWFVGKVVRFYYAINGNPMFYKKSGNRVPKTEGCRPMMKLKKKIPKDLDYDKYISLANQYLKELGK